MKNVLFPQFELVGPPCERFLCKGVLIAHINIVTKEFFQCCSICKYEFNHMSGHVALAHAVQIIDEILKERNE